MNRTSIVIAYFALVLAALVGLVVVLISQPTSLDAYVAAVGVILALASAAALQLGGVAKLHDQAQKQEKTLDAVQKQTNGTTSTLTAQVERLVELLGASAPVVEPAPATGAISTGGGLVDAGPARHAL